MRGALTGHNNKSGTAAFADRLSYGVIALSIGLVLMTFGDYGIGWDDPEQARYGDHIVNFFASLGADDSVFNFGNFSLYGGLFEAPVQLLGAVVDKTFGFAIYDTRHLATGLVGVLGLVGTWRMARYLGGPVAGLMAMMVLAMTPSYLGHAFINTKDIPFAVGTIWSLYFMARAFETMPQISLNTAVGLGVALGATMGVRIGGVVLVGYIFVLVVFHLAWVNARPKLEKEALRHVARMRTVTILVALVLTFALWPGAWSNPLGMVYVALNQTARFEIAIPVLFMGETFQSTELPRTYLPVHLWVKLPPVFLVTFAIAFPLGLVGLWRAFFNTDRKAVFGYLALGLGIFFPALFTMVMHSAHYDGVRHFLFMFPPMAVLVGIEMARLGCILHRRHPAMAVAAAMVFALGLGEAGLAMSRLHPYSYVYYNAFAGGLKGAEGRYELDYWSISYREAARELVRYAEGQPLPESGRWRVSVCGSEETATAFLPPRFEGVVNVEEADFLIGVTRWSCDKAIEAPIVAEIKRHGVRLSVVRDLRGGYTEKRYYPGTMTLRPL